MAEKGIKGNTNRIRLEEHIPLDTPLHVLLDASSVCNFHCSFCPHGNKDALEMMSQAIMSVELAEKCIDDLTMFPRKIKRISFFENGEPLVNPNLPEIIAYAKSKRVSDCFCITTNASLLTREKSKELIDAGLNHIDISIYGLDDKTYLEFSHNQISFKKILNQVSDCFDQMKNGEVVVKITDAVIHSQEELDRFYEMFSPICNKICVEHVVPMWYDFELETSYDGRNIYGKPVIHKDVCPIPFYELSVQANGLITPCCNDWKHSCILGDATKDSIFSVWNGKKHNDMCKTLLKQGTKSLYPCNRCHYHEFVGMDNIDDYRYQLLERMGD